MLVLIVDQPMTASASGRVPRQGDHLGGIVHLEARQLRVKRV
jgi:hypothetical protein